MAIIKERVLSEDAEDQSVKWVNEHGHDVLYRPTTLHYNIGPSDALHIVYLYDPTNTKPDLGVGEHYRVTVKGMSIIGAAKCVHRDSPFLMQENHQIDDITEVPLLPEQYPLFMVGVDHSFYPMNEYYEKELYKA